MPKDGVPLTIGKNTSYVYPTINDSMSHAEKSYGFMITKFSLETADVEIKSKYQVFGDITGSTSLVSIITARFTSRGNAFILKPNNFEILSYHNRVGMIIQDCFLPNGHLKPTDNQTDTNRRPAGIHFVKLVVDLNFKDIDASHVQIYPYTFFVRLKSEEKTVQNSVGTDKLLRTFFGPDDWAQSNDVSIIDSVLNSKKEKKTFSS